MVYTQRQLNNRKRVRSVQNRKATAIENTQLQILKTHKYHIIMILILCSTIKDMLNC